MNVTSRMIPFAALVSLLGLGACGGREGGATVIGPAGGTVFGPNGTKVVVPPGALAADTTIEIEQTSLGSPPLPGGLSAAGLMFAFTPHGATFGLPVTVTLPIDPTTVPAGHCVNRSG